jgi:hypothetical protein
VFNLVPLLKDRMISEEVLHVLLQLSERPEFRNVFMAAGRADERSGLLCGMRVRSNRCQVCIGLW